MLSEPNDRLAAEAAKYRMVGYGGGRLTVRAVKRLLDGALGSRGAWLLAPYSDLPTSTGLVTYPLADLAETARIAAANDLQLCVHAIGDRANRELLDLYEATFAAHPERRDWRWRVEHAQILDPADLPGPRTRAETVIRLAGALASGELDLSPGADRDTARRALASLRGIGPWTVELIAMRGLGDPDAFPATDLGLVRALDAVGGPNPERWRPWRSYAAQYLCATLDHPINRLPADRTP